MKPGIGSRTTRCRIQWLLPLAVLLLLTLTTACDIGISTGGDEADAIVGSGNVVSRDFEFEGFNGIDSSHAFGVTVTHAGVFSVTVKADDNVMDLVVVEKDGTTLRIGLKPQSNVRSHYTLEARISMPELARINLSGASRLHFDGFSETMPMDFNLSGASYVEGDLNSGAVSIDLSGASRAELSGSARVLELSASGASRAELGDLTVGTLTAVELSGASSGTIAVTEAIESIRLSGASHLVYSGNPTLGKVDTSDRSDIHHR